jgi:hypothetical protein
VEVPRQIRPCHAVFVKAFFEPFPEFFGVYHMIIFGTRKKNVKKNFENLFFFD